MGVGLGPAIIVICSLSRSRRNVERDAMAPPNRSSTTEAQHSYCMFSWNRTSGILGPRHGWICKTGPDTMVLHVLDFVLLSRQMHPHARWIS
jgi:hypothetical protein